MAKQTGTPPIGKPPNNLGPTLLIIGGSFLLPPLLGIPLLLLGIGQLRRADGSRAVTGWPILLPCIGLSRPRRKAAAMPAASARTPNRSTVAPERPTTG